MSVKSIHGDNSRASPVPSSDNSLETRVSRLEELLDTQSHHIQDDLDQLEQRLESLEYHQNFSAGTWTPDMHAYYYPYPSPAPSAPSNNKKPKRLDLRTKSLRAMKELMCLRQLESVERYAIYFQELAKTLEMEQSMLVEVFYLGLKESIQELMVPYGSFVSLEHFIEKCVAIEQTVEYSNVHREGPLVQEERERRIDTGLCLYCGGFGHTSRGCVRGRRAHMLKKQSASA